MSESKPESNLTATKPQQPVASSAHPQEPYFTSFLERAGDHLSKIASSAENVTVCRAQIDHLHDRCTSLLEALLVDSMTLPQPKIQEAVRHIEALLKKIHEKVVQVAIYGRAKALVFRSEISGDIESFNLELDNCLFSWQVSDHSELYAWNEEFRANFLVDETQAWMDADLVIKNEADLKVILVMGDEAITVFRNTILAALAEDALTSEQRDRYQYCLQVRLPRPTGSGIASASGTSTPSHIGLGRGKGSKKGKEADYDYIPPSPSQPRELGEAGKRKLAEAEAERTAWIKEPEGPPPPSSSYIAPPPITHGDDPPPFTDD